MNLTLLPKFLLFKIFNHVLFPTKLEMIKENHFYNPTHFDRLVYLNKYFLGLCKEYTKSLIVDFTNETFLPTPKQFLPLVYRHFTISIFWINYILISEEGKMWACKVISNRQKTIYKSYLGMVNCMLQNKNDDCAIALINTLYGHLFFTEFCSSINAINNCDYAYELIKFMGLLTKRKVVLKHFKEKFGDIPIFKLYENSSMLEPFGNFMNLFLEERLK